MRYNNEEWKMYDKHSLVASVLDAGQGSILFHQCKDLLVSNVTSIDTNVIKEDRKSKLAIRKRMEEIGICEDDLLYTLKISVRFCDDVVICGVVGGFSDSGVTLENLTLFPVYLQSGELGNLKETFYDFIVENFIERFYQDKINNSFLEFSTKIENHDALQEYFQTLGKAEIKQFVLFFKNANQDKFVCDFVKSHIQFLEDINRKHELSKILQALCP
jgi:hypothetical protein